MAFTEEWTSATTVPPGTHNPLWVSGSGNWQVTGGTGVLQPTDSGTCFLRWNENQGVNHYAETRVTVGSGLTNWLSAVIVGGTPDAFGAAGPYSSSRHVEFALRPGIAYIEEKTASSSWVNLGQVNFTSPAHPYTMRCEVQDGQVFGYVNGALVVGPVTPTIVLGQQVGHRTFRMNAPTSYDRTLGGSLTVTDITGNLSVVLPALTAGFTGVVDILGDLQITLPAMTGVFTGEVAWPVISGDLAIVLPAMTASLTGEVEPVAPVMRDITVLGTTTPVNPWEVYAPTIDVLTAVLPTLAWTAAQPKLTFTTIAPEIEVWATEAPSLPGVWTVEDAVNRWSTEEPGTSWTTVEPTY